MLTVSDVQVDSHLHPTRLCSAPYRESKTDQFGIGVMLHLDATGDQLCPVTAMVTTTNSAHPNERLSPLLKEHAFVEFEVHVTLLHSHQVATLIHVCVEE